MGEKGIIYPDGKPNDWYWYYAKIVDIPEEDRDKYDGHSKRLDIENPQKFGQFEFMDACKAMGIILEGAGDVKVVDEKKKIYRVDIDKSTKQIYSELKSVIKQNGIYRTYNYDKAKKSQVFLEDLRLPPSFVKELIGDN